MTKKISRLNTRLNAMITSECLSNDYVVNMINCIEL